VNVVMTRAGYEALRDRNEIKHMPEPDEWCRDPRWPDLVLQARWDLPPRVRRFTGWDAYKVEIAG
jgi:hypothetical protein